jgi:carbamoyltransferase
MKILGISCFYHDSAASLVSDGEIKSAVQEERFTRVKHDPRFPQNAIDFCLRDANLNPYDLDYVVYYDKPIMTFDRLLSSYLYTAPFSVRSWLKSMPLWLGQKLRVKKIIKKALKGFKGEVLFSEHHFSHAASAFYPSPFKEAAILTVDGVGEWATASVGYGKGSDIWLLKELKFPNSVGLLYSAFTYFTGFKVNSGEYKLMGLAPYGKPIYKDIILKELVDIKEDGSIRLNLHYFDFIGGLKMTNSRFSELFGGPPRKPESQLTVREMDLAASIQSVTEEIVIRMANHAYNETKIDNLCMAGGVALNCVANGKILKNTPFKNLWIQPAAGDAGGALGAALSVWYLLGKGERVTDEKNDFQNGSYLGLAYSEKEIRDFLISKKYPYTEIVKSKAPKVIAEKIADGKVVGLFSGRMEFGPRALGARSILADPRNIETQKFLNLKIKFRESFRPFAPSVLEEDVDEYFEDSIPSPYMLLTTHLKEEKRYPMDESISQGDVIKRLMQKRSDVPAITHLDYSARIQTVSKTTNPFYHSVISEFKNITGVGMVVNTSFNVRGEPIVCTIEDAYRCFMKTNMDVLFIENFMLLKEEQPELNIEPNQKEVFELD